jgi:fido (protein-threonine AMPylation protein)
VPIAWNDDPPGSEALIRVNIVGVLRRIAADAAARRVEPTVAAAQDWHRAIYAGVELPVPYYAGEVRDTDPRFPELTGYEVGVGSRPGVISAQVPQQLDRFEGQAQEAVAHLDDLLPPGTGLGHDELYSVLTLIASLHGEWVRIHPFANGNGRTARIWANWAALRYGLPPFVILKPRPEGIGYRLAAHRSMQRDHSVLVGVLAQMLTEHLRG